MPFIGNSKNTAGTNHTTPGEWQEIGGKGQGHVTTKIEKKA